jgi:hypothetical protein
VIVIAGLIALTAVIQFSRLGSAPLWLDEGYSHAISGMSWREIWIDVSAFDVHPKLYYFLLKIWRIFGESEFALRSLSVVGALLTIPFIYYLGRIVSDPASRLPAAFAATLFALSPFHLDYALQARPYTWLTLSVAVGLFGAAWLFGHPNAANRPWLDIRHFRRPKLDDTDSGSAFPAWTAVIVGSAGALWFHNTAFAFVGALALIALFFLAKDKFPAWFLGNMVLAGLLVLALWAPFLSIFIFQLNSVAEVFWTPELTWDGAIAPVVQLSAVGLVYPVTMAPMIVILCYVGAKAMIASGRGRAAALLLGVVGIGYGLCLAFSVFVQPIMVQRIFSWMNLPLLMCVACGAAAIDRRILKRGAIGVLLLASAYGTWHRLHWPGTEPWDEIATNIAAEPGSNKVVLLVPSTLSMPLRYYLDTQSKDLTVKSIPEEFPSFNTTRPYASNPSILLVQEQDEPTIRDYVLSARVLWIIRRMPDLNDPTDIVLRVARQHRQEVSTWQISPHFSVHRFE